MRCQSLALATQSMIQAMYGEVIDRGSYLVFRTPEVPDYWYGNCLILPKAPGSGDYARWQDLFQREFPSSRHRVFQLDDPQGAAGSSAAFEAAGFEFSRHAVLATHRVVEPARLGRVSCCRPAEHDDDWAAVIETAWLTNRDSPGFDRAFLERKFAVLRRVVAEGHGAWWGIWENGLNLAHMGLFWQDGLVRFQAVATHPEHRRQGLCRTLLYAACRQVEAVRGRQTFVIMPEDDSVSRIYESVGFAIAEYSADYCLPPPEFR